MKRELVYWHGKVMCVPADRSNKNWYQCEHCGREFPARACDRARGWARFCSKSCAWKYRQSQKDK